MRHDYVGIAPCGHVKHIFCADAATSADRAFVRECIAGAKAAGLRLVLRERDEAVRLFLKSMDCRCRPEEASE